MLVQSKFALSRNRVNYLVSKHEKRADFNTAVFYLQSESYLIRTYQGHEADIPELLLASSGHMKELYRRFGDTVCFDITYNVIVKRSMSNHQWGIGFFVGIGSNMEILVFGFCLICTETK